MSPQPTPRLPLQTIFGVRAESCSAFLSFRLQRHLRYTVFNVAALAEAALLVREARLSQSHHSQHIVVIIDVRRSSNAVTRKRNRPRDAIR